MTKEFLDRLPLEDIELILKDRLNLFTPEEIDQLRRRREQLLEQTSSDRIPERVSDSTVKCPNCGGFNAISHTYCRHCGFSFPNYRGQTTTFTNSAAPESTQRPFLSQESLTNIITSIISFIVTVILRFALDEKVDLTPEALYYSPGMAVSNNMKPFLIAISAIVGLITVSKTVLSTTMNKREKLLCYVFSGAALLASIAIVNLALELE